MAVEVVAIFVACQLNLLICRDINFNAKFEDFEKCRAYVSKVTKVETKLRKGWKDKFPIVMGKCRTHLKGN